MELIKDLTQLMLGNYAIDDEGIVVIIEALASDNALVNGYSENGCLFSKEEYPKLLFESEIYAIKLSKKWMYDFGFGMVNKTDPQEFNNIVAFKKDKIEYYHNTCDNSFWCSEACNSIDITSVHQLQNLHFALTGINLTIK